MLAATAEHRRADQAPALRSFATGLLQDLDAVVAGLTKPEANGGIDHAPPSLRVPGPAGGPLPGERAPHRRLRRV